jgi:hypothetical protein
LNESDDEINQCGRCQRYLTLTVSEQRVEQDDDWCDSEDDRENSDKRVEEDEANSASELADFRRRDAQLTGLSVIW